MAVGYGVKNIYWHWKKDNGSGVLQVTLKSTVGVKLMTKEMKPYEKRIEGSNSQPRWDITIEPLNG
jgi:hypothetical protein